MIPSDAYTIDGLKPDRKDDGYIPPGEPLSQFTGQATARDNLLISEWLKLKLPPRDYLLGDVICTTSRWLIIGETGVGKTLFSLEMAAAISAGKDFLGWSGKRSARVMYLDGEMPAETFQDRMKLVAAQFGGDIELFGYNRDVLSADEMPPLNTEDGQKWLLREIETLKPDAIFFDSVMCLLAGKMGDEEAWGQIKGMMRQISGRRIAQIWLHHTGHDATKGFGTKTREWEMDTVLMLSKIDDESGMIENGAPTEFQIEFKKARLKTPSNFKQFSTQIVRRQEWGFVNQGPGASKSAKPKTQIAILKQALVESYERLAEGVEKTAGFDGKPVRKVAVDDLRNSVKDRGFLELTENNQISASGRKSFGRAKNQLLSSKSFTEANCLIWRLK